MSDSLWHLDKMHPCLQGSYTDEDFSLIVCLLGFSYQKPCLKVGLIYTMFRSDTVYTVCTMTVPFSPSVFFLNSDFQISSQHKLLLLFNWPLHETHPCLYSICVFQRYLCISCALCVDTIVSQTSHSSKSRMWDLQNNTKLCECALGLKHDSMFVPGISIHLPMCQVSRPQFSSSCKK